jgi:hypothetical protein
MGQGGNRLRSRLLVGVATVALSAPFVHRAIAQQMADKFQPHIEAGGFGTNEHSGGDVDMFLPLWQDPTSLLFGDLRGTFTGQPAQSGSFGLGYRTQVDPEWILGGYGFFDLKHTDNDNTFFQGSVGLEALSIDWDFRVNGYFPFNSDSGSTKTSGVGGLNGSGLTIIGTDIGFHSESQQEKALFGVDGEVGWRVPIFPADGDMDLRVFAGGFYFSASDTDTLAGPRGRIELRLYDLDLLGVQSRLTAQGLVQWDDHRGTIGGGGLELRIPLGGFFGQPETKLSAIDRRMVDRVVRDPEVIETRMATKDETRIQDVQVDGLINTPTHKIVFADANGVAGNSGAQGDETTLNAAPGKFPGQNEIIVAQGNEGDIHVSNPVQLQNGQSLLGGGTPVGVTLVGGPNDGHHIIFTPPGTTPNVVGNDNTKNLIEMASGSQNRITGLSMTGQFLNAIHGLNMYRAVITDNFGSGGAANGVFLEQSEPGAQPSSTVYIFRNEFDLNGSDGIRVENHFGDGQSHQQIVTILYNFVGGNGGNGIAVSNEVSGANTSLNQSFIEVNNFAVDNGGDGFVLQNTALNGGRISQGSFLGPAFFHYNIAIFNGGNGAAFHNDASGAGSAISQALLIDTNLASSNGGTGILVTNDAKNGAVISQGVTIDPNTVVANAYDGIALLNFATGAGAQVNQTALVSGNIAFGNGTGAGTGYYKNGIAVGNTALSGGAISQAIGIENNQIGFNKYNGILAFNIVQSGSTINQSADISFNTIGDNGRQGIYLFNQAGSSNAPGIAGGSITQVVTGFSDTVFGNVNGVRLGNFAYSGGSVISQSVTLTDSTITGNASNGVQLINNALSGALISQAVTIDPSVITFNSAQGVYGLNNVTSATLHQTIALLFDTISYNGLNGVRITTPSAVAADITFDLTAGGNQINRNGANGIYVSAGLLGGSTLSQSVVALSNGITSDPGFGIAVLASADNSTVSQRVTVSYNNIVDVGSDGVAVKLQGVSNSTLRQIVTVNANSIIDPGVHGINVAATGFSNTAVYQSVGINRNVVVSDGLGFDAIRVSASVGVDSSLTQGVGIHDNTVVSAGDNGIYVAGLASSFTAFTQGVFIGGNSILGANGDGIFVETELTSALGGAASAQVAVYNNFISGASVHGIHVLTELSSATLAETLFHIDGNTVTHVSETGIYVANFVNSASVLTQGISGGLPEDGSATVNNNTVSYVSLSGGIIVSNHVSGLGTSLSQVMSISQNSVHNVRYAGIKVATGLYTTGQAVQTFNINNNTIADVQKLQLLGSASGIWVANNVGDANSAATQTQTLTITGNSINNIGDDLGSSAVLGFGVVVVNSAGLSSTISQAATIATNSISNIYGGIAAGGIDNFNIAGESGAAISQTIGINDNTIHDVNGATIIGGIGNTNLVATGANVSQALTIDPNTIVNIGTTIGSAGIALGILNLNLLDPSATLTQTAIIESNIVSNVVAFATAAGIATYNDVGASGFLSQNLTVAGNQISSVNIGLSSGFAAGISVISNFEGEAGSSAAGVQTVDLSNNTINAVNGAGVFVRNDLTSAAVTQSAVGINQNTITNVSLAGVYVANRLVSGSTLTQGLSIDSNTISHVVAGLTDAGLGLSSAASGISVYNALGSGSVLSQTVSATGNNISDVTAPTSVPAFGIALVTKAYGVAGNTASVTQTVDLSSNTINSINGDGIFVRNNLYSAAQTQTVTASQNTISNVSFTGIYVGNHVSGSVLSQGLTFNSNTITNVSAATSFAFGIAVYTEGRSGSTVSQSIAIGANTIANVQASSGLVAGIAIGNRIGDNYVVGATQTQTLSITGNTITHVGDLTSAHALYGFGILVSNFAGSVSTITQSATIANNSIAGVYGSARAVGIENFNQVTSTGVINQTIAIDDNNISSVHGIGIIAGIDVYNQISGGTISQALSIDPNTIRDIGGTSASIAGGILVQNGMWSGTLSQTVDIASNDVSGVTAAGIAAGISVYTRARSGALVVQNIQISGNGVSNITVPNVSGAPAAAGISVITYALGVVGNTATVSQVVGITSNHVANVDGYVGSVAGIALLNHAENGFISQNVSIGGNTANNIAGTGILVGNVAGPGGTIYQGTVAIVSSAAVVNAGLFVSGNTALSNAGDGISLLNVAVTGGTILQAAYVDFNTAARNDQAGVNFFASTDGGNVSQFISMEGNSIRRNNGSGLRAGAYGAGTVQEIDLTSSGTGNFITSNAGVGVFLGGNAGPVDQHINLYSTNLGGAGPNVVIGNTPNVFNGGTGSYTP